MQKKKLANLTNAMVKVYMDQNIINKSTHDNGDCGTAGSSAEEGTNVSD